MDGEETEDRAVKAVLSQFGVLCPGGQGLMSNVPQVVTRKGGMPAPRTRLQHLVDSEVLLKKKRRSDTTHLTSSGGRHRKCHSRELVSVRY